MFSLISLNSFKMLLSCDMLNTLKEVSGKWSNARFDVTASHHGQTIWASGGIYYTACTSHMVKSVDRNRHVNRLYCSFHPHFSRSCTWSQNAFDSEWHLLGLWLQRAREATNYFSPSENKQKWEPLHIITRVKVPQPVNFVTCELSMWPPPTRNALGNSDQVKVCHFQTDSVEQACWRSALLPLSRCAGLSFFPFFLF